MKSSQIITNFTAGEMSPQLEGRTDIEMYFRGVKKLENFLPRPYGGAFRRPGTYYVNEVKTSSKKTRMITFIFSNVQAYILEIGDYYMRFYKDEGQIVKSTADAWITSTAYVVGNYVTSGTVKYYCTTAHTSGTFATDLTAGKWIAQDIYEIPTPWSEAQIWDIQFAQSFDVMYLVHPSYSPRKLTRTAHDAWTMTTPAFTFANAWITNTDYAVGNYITNGGTTYKCLVYHTSGTFATDLSNGKWTAETRTPWDGTKGYPNAVTFYEQRLWFGRTQTIWGSQTAVYENMSLGTGDTDGVEFTIATDKSCIIEWLTTGAILEIGTTGGPFWGSSGSDVRTITPSNISIKQANHYSVADASPKHIGQYLYFWQKNGRILREQTYTLETDSYNASNATILAEHISESGIVDMAYQQSPDNLLWCVRADGKMAVLTREHDQKVLAWSTQVTDGLFESVAVIPVDGYDQIWTIVRRKINGTWKRYVEFFKPLEYGNDQEDAFYVDCGLSLNDPKTITGATAANPVVITAVAHGFSNGDKVRIRNVEGMTELNRFRFTIANKTNDTFELVGIDGTGYAAYEQGGEVRKCVDTITGLFHLEGKTVAILADGAAQPEETVSGGSVTIPDKYGEIHAGLKQTPKLLTNRLEVQTATGTAQGKTQRIYKAMVRFYKSLGCKVGSEDRQETMIFRTAAMPMEPSPELYTGDKNITYPGGYTKDARIYITSDTPTPLNILAIVPFMETADF
jgi:hypothetical protein